MAETSDDRVELTDLDVITRFSLAVRAATAPRAEVIAALRSDLEWLQGSRRSSGAGAEAAARPATRKAAPARAATKRAAPSRSTRGR